MVVEVVKKMTVKEFIKLTEEYREIEFQYRGEHYLIGIYWVKNGFFSFKGHVVYCFYPPNADKKDIREYASVEELLGTKMEDKKLKDILDSIEILDMF